MNFRLYSIILLICGSLLICIFLINKEGFKSDYTDYNSIDRIMNSSKEYAYCIAGNVTCNDSSLKIINDDYKGGKTYEFLCSDNTYAECSGNFFHKRDYFEWITPTAREIPFSFSDKYKGFTDTYTRDYIPVKIVDNYINFYDETNNLLDSINKCDLLNSQHETDKCYSSLNNSNSTQSPQIQTTIQGTPQTTIQGTPQTTIQGTTKKPIDSKQCINPSKCIANYGTRIGEPLCCNQSGVLHKSALKYVCPSSKPTCSNYVCGEKYGTCK